MRLSLVEILLLLTAAAIVAFGLLRFVHQHNRRVRARVVASWTRTPGVLNPSVTQASISSTICVPGWTRTVRPPVSYTNHLKRVQIVEYGLHGGLGGFQEDHLISLELGGNATDPRNLWPEPYPRAATVDRIENQLNHEVCTGALSLAGAQRKESVLKHTDG